ncbi:hypothetical protein CFIMG_006728RA [Ceratocystis fimbriata CBS 114723]|uniref:Uncharacterized protein n=1 Tax=Ceratocystis fimbriata CBS 114723 TaxID=1035309 RepID=A0A2C5WTH7_9PEZI|nr:hypothetical protein CFIMG_006728RA [Ceratocystis fimbriata CBS 114723]
MPAPVPLASQHEAHLLQSNLHGYGISHDNTWIMKDGQRALWLPPGWRLMASSVAVSGTKFGIGCISGRVLVIGFKSAG